MTMTETMLAIEPDRNTHHTYFQRRQTKGT